MSQGWGQNGLETFADANREASADGDMDKQFAGPVLLNTSMRGDSLTQRQRLGLVSGLSFGAVREAEKLSESFVKFPSIPTVGLFELVGDLVYGSGNTSPAE